MTFALQQMVEPIPINSFYSYILFFYYFKTQIKLDSYRFYSEMIPPPITAPVDPRRKIVPYNDLESLAFEDSFI